MTDNRNTEGSTMDADGMAANASKALKGAVRLSNEVIGTMGLMERGIPVTPGIVAAMRRYVADVEAYIDALERRR